MSDNGFTNNGFTNSKSGSCDGFLDLLPLYEGGELELQQADSLREHLDSCAACHAQWVVGKRAITMRQEAWALQAGQTPDLWPEIQAQLRAEELVPAMGAVAPVQAAGGVLLRFPMLRFAAAAALLVGAFALGSQFMDSEPGGVIGPEPGGVVAPDGGSVVADGRSIHSQQKETPSAPGASLAASHGVLAEPVVELAEGRLRLVGPGETSVLEEAPSWGLEEAPAVDLRRRGESMQAAGWR